jgi:tRNA-(ms[2]io[6]A)-hydroxylase
MPQVSASLADAMQAIDSFLLCPTPDAWLDAATRNLPALLSDHANCEKKAASTALSLCYRYQLPVSVLAGLSRLAREELRHFEQVLALMQELGMTYEVVSASSYAGALRAGVTHREPLKLIDTLIVCAIVEARSCERFSRLAPRLEGALRDFYLRLLASEARHFELYLDLARGQAEEAGLTRDLFDARVSALLALDQAAIVQPSTQLRFHSGPPSAASSASGSLTSTVTA